MGTTQGIGIRQRGSRCAVPAAVAGLAVLVCLLAPTLAAAAQYYVDPSNPQASDDNPGSAAQPFHTVEGAAAVLQPGDTLVYVAGGEATGTPEGQGAATPAQAATGTGGGTPAAESSSLSQYLLPAGMAAGALALAACILLYFKVLQPRKRRRVLLEALAIIERDERASFDHAEELLNEALVSGLKSDDVDVARFALAWVRARSGDLAEASGAVAELVKSGDTSPETAYLDMWLASQREEHERVEKVYEIHGQRLGDFLDTKLIASIAFLALARVRWSNRQIEGARHYFEAVRKLGVLAERVPSGVDDHQVMLGVLALFEKNVEQARRHFTGSVESARAGGQSPLLGELGLLLCEWRDDGQADVEERLGEIVESLAAQAGDGVETADDDEEGRLTDERLLLRGARLWHAVALLASWQRRKKGSGLPKVSQGQLKSRLLGVKEVDPDMGDPYLVGGLIGYYFAPDDDKRRPFIDELEAAIERDVSLPEVVDLVQRERKLDKLAEDAVKTFLDLARRYVGDTDIPESLRAKLRERLGRHSQFGDLSDLDIERSQTDTVSVVQSVHGRAELMESRVRSIVRTRLRGHPEAERLEKLLSALHEHTVALKDVAGAVDETGNELMCTTGEFLLSEEETATHGDDGQGAAT